MTHHVFNLTASDLLTVDKQEAFDIMVARLADGRGRAFGVTAREPEPSVCLYRAPDGNRCVFGALIRDESYRPEMEVQPASSLMDDSIDLEFQRLCTAMQANHDFETNWDGNTYTQWYDVYQLGRRHNLDTSKVPT